MCVVMLLSMTVMSVNALNIYDNNGNVVGTSVLTCSDSCRIYTLKVTDNSGSGAYGAIYLYDSNGKTKENSATKRVTPYPT